MSEEQTTISERYRALEKQDNEMRRAALRAVSEQIRPLFLALQEECARTGHCWVFGHWNWDRSYAWDKCQWCGAVEGADKHA